MARSFDLVDWKVAETEFFLKRIPECNFNFFAVRYYVNAFVSSSRSITFALQSCLNGLEGFARWYEERQSRLKQDSLARFFNEFRRINQHIGDNFVGGGAGGPDRKPLYFFSPTPDLKEVPSEDVESTCKRHFVMILDLVYSCYLEFGPSIDPKQHYTEEHFAKMGKTIEDAEEELFGIHGWTKVPGYPDAYRWQALRDSQPGCSINHIFDEYLGKTIPEPKRLPDLPRPEGKGWYQTAQGGRVWIPPDSRISDDPNECLAHFLNTVASDKNEDQ